MCVLVIVIVIITYVLWWSFDVSEIALNLTIQNIVLLHNYMHYWCAIDRYTLCS